MPSSEQRCRGCGRAIPSGSDTCDDGEVCWECVARGEPTPPQAVPEHNHVTREIRQDGSCPACALTVAIEDMGDEAPLAMKQLWGELNPPQAEVICPCGSPVPHCHCEEYPETHRHPGPPENAVPPVHHVHDTDGAEAGERQP